MVAQLFLNIYNTFMKVWDYVYPPQTSYHLYLLKKELQSHYDFLLSQEKELLNKYSVTFSEKNEISFNSETDQRNFFKEHDALLKIQINTDGIKKIKMKINELPKILSPSDYELLSYFIDFIEEGDIENG